MKINDVSLNSARAMLESIYNTDGFIDDRSRRSKTSGTPHSICDAIDEYGICGLKGHWVSNFSLLLLSDCAMNGSRSYLPRVYDFLILKQSSVSFRKLQHRALSSGNH